MSENNIRRGDVVYWLDGDEYFEGSVLLIRENHFARQLRYGLGIPVPLSAQAVIRLSKNTRVVVDAEKLQPVA